MATASATYHEAAEDLRPETQDDHRALNSLMEELEAVDWYGQRIDATSDAELKAILEHNRDEEKEHAAALLEWLRRRDSKWDQYLRNFLFTERPLRELQKEAESAAPSPEPAASP